MATRSSVCPETGRVCNVYSTCSRGRCLQVAGQVDVIRAGNGAGEESGGNARPQSVVRGAGGKREGSARPPGARSPGSRLRWEGRGCHSRGARSRRGARSSRARAASAASAWRGRPAAGRGAMGECAARGAPQGSASGRKWVSAGRPGIAHLPAAVCGLFSGSQAGERGGPRRWAPGEDRAPEGSPRVGVMGGAEFEAGGLSPRAPQEQAETGRGEWGLRATSTRSGLGAGRRRGRARRDTFQPPPPPSALAAQRLQVEAEG